MIEVDIPSIDPIQHEPKLILGMTFRQAVCAIVGGGLGIGAFFLLYAFTQDVDLPILGCLIFVLPAVLMGWYKPYNMKAEDYLKLIIYNNFVASPTRILKTDDAEDIKLPTLQERLAMEKKLQQVEMKKKKAAAQKQNKQKKGGPN